MRLLQRFERVVLEQLDLLARRPRSIAVLLHLLLVAFPVEGQVVLGGHGLEQLGREAVGLVHLGRLGARRPCRGPAVFIWSKIRSIRSRPASIVPRKLALLLLDHLGHPLDRLAQLGIGRLHQLGHGAAPACAGTARGRPSGGRRARPGASSRLMTYFSLLGPG